MSQLISPEQLEASLDQDITLCSFAQAFEDDVLYGAIKYNPKSKLYKFFEQNVVMLARTKCEFVCQYYNDYHSLARKRKEAA